MESISIIIPTLNEQSFVGNLLDALTDQTYRNFEIIISDGISSDRTIQIVKKFRKEFPLQIVTSKKRSPAHQRNKGASKSRFERLLFLDADTIPSKNFLEKAMYEMQREHLDIAQPFSLPLSDNPFDKYLFRFTNWSSTLMSRFYPLTGGWALFSTRTLHETIHGFDENLHIIAEDLDYAQRAKASGFTFGMLDVPIAISVRRLELEGRVGTLKNLLVNSVYFALYGRRQAQKYIRREYGTYSQLGKLE